MEPKERLGLRIQALRKKLRMSQDDLSAKVGLARVTINRIEGGKVWPEFENLEALAKSLETTVDDLIDPHHEPMSQKTQLLELVAAFDENKAKLLLPEAKALAAGLSKAASARAQPMKPGERKSGTD